MGQHWLALIRGDFENLNRPIISRPISFLRSCSFWLLAAVCTGSLAAPGLDAQARSSASGPAFDACRLLTKPEAAAAVGTSVEQKFNGAMPAVMPGIDVWGCNYDAPTSMGEIKLAVWRFAAAVGTTREAYRARCARKEGVPGLGDVSCWYNTQHTELQVLKGPTLLIISLSRKGDAAEPIKTIAKTALSRLSADGR